MQDTGAQNLILSGAAYKKALSSAILTVQMNTNLQMHLNVGIFFTVKYSTRMKANQMLFVYVYISATQMIAFWINIIFKNC